jgi:hypothetical protein
MWIKFKLEGELEQLIKQQSEDECRTCSQQALFILKNYYKNKKILNNSDVEQNKTEQNIQNKNGIEKNELEYKRNNSNKMEQSRTISSNTVKIENDIEQSVLDEVCAF